MLGRGYAVVAGVPWKTNESFPNRIFTSQCPGTRPMTIHREKSLSIKDVQNLANGLMHLRQNGHAVFLVESKALSG